MPQPTFFARQLQLSLLGGEKGEGGGAGPEEGGRAGEVVFNLCYIELSETRLQENYLASDFAQ